MKRKVKGAFERRSPITDEYKSNLERRYAERLELMRMAGDILDWRYEAIRVRLGRNHNYTVDFLIRMPDGSTEAHEVKGWHKNIRDSVSKWKSAAERIPWFKWVFVTWKEGAWHGRKY